MKESESGEGPRQVSLDEGHGGLAITAFLWDSCLNR
jgi:hypothetical protein